MRILDPGRGRLSRLAHRPAFFCARSRGGHRRQLRPARRWHLDRGTDSLTPIASLADRLDAWREISGREITAHVGDVQDADFVERVVGDFLPEAVVHYAEHSSAPYSMLSAPSRG